MSILIPYQQLSEEQKAVVRRVSRSDNSLYVEGPAGSGKTLISMYAVKDLIESEAGSILFLMYNHSLLGYLRTAIQELGVVNGATIATKDKFFWDLARKDINGIQDIINSNEPYDFKYIKILNRTQALIDINNIFDIVIVDEVQDISIQELNLIKRIGKKVLALGDFNQGIYETDMTQAIMEQIGDHEKLSTVFRYHIEIAKIANNFTNRDLTSLVKSGNGVTPKIIDVPTNNVNEEIANVLDSLKARKTRVGVICPDRELLKALKSYLDIRGIDNVYYEKNINFKNHDFTSNVPLLVSSFSAKGLEFESVIVFGFNKFNPSIQKLEFKKMLKEVIFVSLTRCNSDLFVIRSPEEHELIKGIKVETNAKQIESVDDLLNDLLSL
ncbi:AAA family ATPase [Myroides odoratimimus]|uniref:AAA family ATPase n=1 Tax=Myroides odoratimimus TaxID=76832 RepID=UPI003D2F6B3F